MEALPLIAAQLLDKVGLLNFRTMKNVLISIKAQGESDYEILEDGSVLITGEIISISKNTNHKLKDDYNKLTDLQKQAYKRLPKDFKVKEVSNDVFVATGCSEKTLRRLLVNKNLFTKLSHGTYQKKDL